MTSRHLAKSQPMILTSPRYFSFGVRVHSTKRLFKPFAANNEQRTWCVANKDRDSNRGQDKTKGEIFGLSHCLGPYEDERFHTAFYKPFVPGLFWFRPIEFFTIGVSIRLSDRSLHREEQKKIVKNCPQWVWNQDLRIIRPIPYQLS